jgi:hypothetical protein
MSLIQWMMIDSFREQETMSYKNIFAYNLVSNLQAYLDLYAREGRDLKQTDYLLSNAIEPRWRST